MGLILRIYIACDMGRQRKAIVVGGGIIGVTSAYALARAGWGVDIIDQRLEVACEASLGNGRQLSYSHANALASPRLLGQIPRLLARRDDALRMSPIGSGSYYTWIIKLLANCTSSAHRKNTQDVLSLAIESRRAMDNLLERHPINFDHKTAGKLVILHTGREVRAAEKMISFKTNAGIRQSLLSFDEAIEIEPALASSPEHIAGAIYAPDDATGDCHRFSTGLLEVVKRHYGVSFIAGTTVSRVSDGEVVLDNGETLTADLIVVANGYQAGKLLTAIGHSASIQPMKGYSFTAPSGNAAPTVSITDNKRRIVFTNLGDRMLVAGIAEMGKVNATVDPARLHAMIDAARASLPEAAVYDQADEGWAGLRPVTPNSQPITRVLAPGLAVNAGHGMLGWTLAMGSGERLARAVRQSTATA